MLSHTYTPRGNTKQAPQPQLNPHPQCKPNPHKPPVKATAKRPDDTQPQSQGSTVQDKPTNSLRGERATCREQTSKTITRRKQSEKVGDEMATAQSRTTTTKWRKIRDERRRIDLEAGVFRCPLCRTGLDWEYSGRPNSAEVDHIKPYAQGGADELSNTRVICRHCNQTRGGREGNARMRAKQSAPKPLKVSRQR